ncbi:MAG: AfsR/SARP family transcriptional regulator [Bacillota bacterium]
MLEHSPEEKCKIEISVLGGFDLKIGEVSLLDHHRSRKLLELLKYFITNRNKRLLPEIIMEDLWPDEEYQNPKNALRTQIFRLRKFLEEITLSYRLEDCLKITFGGGYYTCTLGSDCILDADRFERLVQEGNALKEADPSSAIDTYLEAVSLYKGEYLAENPYQEWTLVARNHYHRLYLQALFRLLELLRQQGRFGDIIQVFEEAVLIEPLEENLHYFYLEALLELEEISQALGHYSYITARMYRELGIKPSPAMRELYRKIRDKSEEKEITDLIFIERKLDSAPESRQGVLFCDVDYFRFLYDLEKRRSGRRKTGVFLGLITLLQVAADTGLSASSPAMEKLKKVLDQCLRKGNVACQWNEAQVILMLTVAKETNLDLIKQRIEDGFKKETRSSTAGLLVKFQPIEEKFVV